MLRKGGHSVNGRLSVKDFPFESVPSITEASFKLAALTALTDFVSCVDPR